MTNHPNRSGASPARNPTPGEIRTARENAGLTQAAAAIRIHGTTRAWQEWEQGNRRMHPGLWELFVIKAFNLSAELAKFDAEVKSAIAEARATRATMNKLLSERKRAKP